MYVVGLERSTNVTFKTSFDSDTKALLLLVPAIIIKRNEWWLVRNNYKDTV